MQNENVEESLTLFFDKCKEHRLKVTPQRIAIYREIIKSRKHPSAEAMFQIVKKAFPSISFDTVNRTLVTFAEIGIVDVVEGRGDPRRFDPDTTAHHHFYCERCGEITDFKNDAYDELEIPKNLQQKYTVLSKRVVLKGICAKCKKRH
jgi:Fur family peroxide stress response transcriptional regulator